MFSGWMIRYYKMLQVLREFFDKKSPILVITIIILISAIILKEYQIDTSFTHAKDLKMFEVVLLFVSSLEVFFKTVVIWIARKCCGGVITCIHVSIILVFLVINLLLYAWSIKLNIVFLNEGVTPVNEPHQFFMQIYSLVFAAVYLTVIGLLISLALENQTMTVLEDEQKQNSNRQSFYA